ncbi:hypothetical protein EDC18_104149 [Natranaerovirga pectinivora]|uniref:YprB ribonuclease H-like domain-containing protein n=1 Tax=Natranaerovirga pectinivora TaxID=682400 RepID=A0A4R3MKS0_9FIRM|nr:ribonuclease H-like domain-containing protein [Natranaerovirga pectinivora]TCT14999.1 hypothetical protein EDC18_104149 [Natranaerovirga pectinivora]
MYLNESELKNVTIDYECLKLLNVDLSSTLIFDIETTGFSSLTNQIYLIGCIYFSNNKVLLKQWLCESLGEEKDILLAFISFIKDFKDIIHFNGSRFDIPFMTKRLNNHNILFDLNTIKEHDLYLNMKHYKDYLNINSLKQKELELYMGINREDKYTGGELIGYFYHFINTKDEGIKDMLLLHNKDDLKGLASILSLFRIPCFFIDLKNRLLTKDYALLVTDHTIEIALENLMDLPKDLNYRNEAFILKISDHKIIIEIPFSDTEMKHFFANYKDYFYLPNEDEAIHKSIGVYVDGSSRIQAKASNCYIKKRGKFIPLFEKIDSCLFKKSYQDSMYYICLDDLQNSISTRENYINHLIQNL